jgi:GNAT superfamily N-acetyltransferase
VISLRHAWHYILHRGVMAAFKAVSRHYLYGAHHCLILETTLAGPPAADHVGDIVFRRATASDLDRLNELDRYRGRGSTHRMRVAEDNDWLFVACHGERIVATRRYSRAVPSASRDGHGLMARIVQLGPNQLWADDTFCLPEYRNRGIARLLGLFAMRFLASLAYTENLGTIATTNTPSIRMAHRQGVRPLYYVSYFRFLFYERLVVSKDIPPAFWPGPKWSGQ